MSVIEYSKSLCLQHQGTVVFADGCDLRVLQATQILQEQKLATPILIGSPCKIYNLARTHAFCLKNVYCYDHLRSDFQQANAELYKKIQQEKGKNITDEESFAQAGNPLIAATLLLHKQEVDMGIGGNISSTADVLRAGLRVLGTDKDIKTVFSFFFMIGPHRDHVYIFTDCAVVPEPNPEQLVDIAAGSARIYEMMVRQQPKVALLSFSTKGSASHHSIDRINAALKIAQKRYADLHIDGELQFDAAIVPEIGAMKAPESPVAGTANVFVFPSLDAGNIAYKIAQRLGKYTSLGPLLYGFAKSWHDVSRGCSAEDIVQITIAGLGMHHRMNS